MYNYIFIFVEHTIQQLSDVNELLENITVIMVILYSQR